MESERFERIQRIFDEALNVPEDAREEFVRQSCGDDVELLAEVLELLRADEEAKQYETKDAIDDAPPTITAPPAPSERAGDAIGRYRLLEQIGEGGFGVVYLAEQQEPVRRRVALKIIKLGMDTKQVIARFEQERQALALMDHPNIARVLDAGATDTGRPYFVMELVKGETITAFCDAHRLSTRARLDLFMQVCHAVQHAHQKGIIHRDIKPSNVIVEVHDDKPVPKVIDFGIAKATSGGTRLTEKTLFTEFRQLVGTPEYMSPEQAGASALDIDTRSDVYSLGVLLYELLTGTTPFDPQRLRSAAYAEIQRIIREDEPQKPSTRLSTLGDSISQVALFRQSDPRSLSRIVRGDLDWIVMKALEKNRARRYETANEFAHDIERHLRSEPVAAGPPSAAYRFRKFARRNRGALTAASLVVIALLAGVIGTTVGMLKAIEAREGEARQAQIARDEAAEAQRQARIALAVNNFLNRDVLSAADPFQTANTGLTVREALEAAGARIEGKFADEPLVEASIRASISMAFRNLGLFHAALPHAERAFVRYKEALGADHAESLLAASNLGAVHWFLGRYDEAEAVWTDTLDRRRRVLGEDHESTRRSIHDLALLYDSQGRHDEAASMHARNLAIQRRVLGDDALPTIVSMIDLATARTNQGRYADAIPLLEEAVERYTRLHTARHPRTLVAMGNLAAVYDRAGREDDALRIMESVLENQPGVLPEDHPFILATMSNISQIYTRRGRHEEAEHMARRSGDFFEQKLGRSSPHTLLSRANLVTSFREQGRFDEAQQLAEELVTIARTELGAEHQATARMIAGLAAVHEARGEHDTAVALFTEAITAAQAAFGPEHVTTAMMERDLGISLTALERLAEAETALLKAHHVLESAWGAEHPQVRRTVEAMVGLYEAWDQPDKAAEWRTRAGE